MFVFNEVEQTKQFQKAIKINGCNLKISVLE
jgi:hypothetical protein